MDEPLLIPASPVLFGMFGRPSRQAQERPLTVVFLTAGLVYRVGPNGMYRRLARLVTDLGHTAVRVDLSGVGESPVSTRSGPPLEGAIAEARNTLDFLGANRGCARFVAAGFCSGANLALDLACVDPRISAVLMINGLAWEDRLKHLDASRVPWLSVFSDGSSALPSRLGDVPGVISEMCDARLRIVRHCDHLFTPLSAQGELISIVRRWLESVPLAPAR